MKEQNFKQTEIGKIPVDWDTKVIDKSVTLKARIGWQGLTTKEYLEIGEYCLITGTDFKNSYIDWDNCVYVEKLRFDQDKNIQIKNNDVLVTKDGTIGKVALVKNVIKPTTLNSGVFVLRPFVKDINSTFLFFVLKSFYFDTFISNITAGSTITHLYQKDFVKFRFVVPPLSEQEKIAEVLSDTDLWIERTEALLAKKRQIKKGAMQKLLSPKDDWEVRKLGEVAEYRRGSFPQPYGLEKWYDEHNGMPFVQVFDVAKNMKLKSTTKQRISDLAKNYSVFVAKGNLVLTIQGSIGRIALTQYDSYVDRTLLIFTNFKIPMDKVFFMYKVYELFQIEKIKAPGGTIKTITKEELSAFIFHFPKSLKTQQEIAEILTSMDLEIESLENRLQKALQLKQGMMQDLLTGKVRLG